MGDMGTTSHLASHLGVSFADRAVEQLCDWPALTVCRAGGGSGEGLALGARQIVHLHGRDEAEVCLTWQMVRRMSGVLLECGRVRLEPGGDWVRVRLDNDRDVALLVSLVSVAIKANISAAREPHHAVAACPHATMASV